MSINLYHTFGIFFEIKRKINTFEIKYRCSYDKDCFSTRIKNKAKFCPNCGAIVEETEINTGTRFLNVWEIEKESGLEEETLFGSMNNPKEYQKYFSINRNLENVINIDISDNPDFNIFMSPNKTPEHYIKEALKNKEFKEITNKLSATFNDDFKIHFGVFSYYI